MAVKLSKKELENINNYKYTTNPWTFCDNLFDPWWTFFCNNLSEVNIIICKTYIILFYIITIIYLESCAKSNYNMWKCFSDNLFHISCNARLIIRRRTTSISSIIKCIRYFLVLNNGCSWWKISKENKQL